jgi:peptidoglycan/LPS O-acetylase OafA/YrhL
MIQRIQSLYLLAVFLIGLFVFFINPTYATFKSANARQEVKLGYVKTTYQVADAAAGGPHTVSKYLNYLIIASLSLGALAAIFLFKKTDLQKKICIYLSLLGVLFILIMFLEYNEQLKQNLPGSLGIGAVFPVLFITGTALAWKNIRADENLLKSMDRIR